MYEQSPSIKVIIQGQEVPRSIVNGDSCMKAINKLTCDRLGIKWETCPFWLRMADTSIVQTVRINSTTGCCH